MISAYNPNYLSRPNIRINVSSEPSDNIKLESQPEVSIITAFYNTGSIFWETYESLVNQTFQNFEWLIINDASKNTEAIQILSEVELLDARIKVIHNPINMGLGVTRNTGVEHAKASYLFFIDSDDMVECTFLEKSILCLKLNPHFSFVGSYTIGFGPKNYLWKHGFIHPSNFLKDNYAVNCFVCRKSVFKKINYNSDRGGLEDWEFWLNAASKGMWGYTIPEFLYWYRERENRAEDWLNFQEDNRRKIQKQFEEKYTNSIKQQVFNLDFTHDRISLSCETEVCSNQKETLLFVLDYSLQEYQIEIIKDYLTEFKKENNISIVINRLENCEYNGDFQDITNDIFIPQNYGSIKDQHNILRYIITSRKVRRVFILNFNNNLLIAPYIKTVCNEVQINLLITKLENNRKIENLINTYNLDSDTIDSIGVFSNELKLKLELNENILGKIFLVPPIKSAAISQRPSPNLLKLKREQIGISTSTFLISFTGTITFNSKFYLLHSIIDQLDRAGISDYLFIFCGWGEALVDFRNYVFEKGIHHKVWIFQTQPYDLQLSDIISASDVLLDITEKSGYTSGLRLAMENGVPIISIGNNYMKDILDFNTGFSLPSETTTIDSIVSEFVAQKIMYLETSPLEKNKISDKSRNKAHYIFNCNNPSFVKYLSINKKKTNPVDYAFQIEALARGIMSVSRD